MKIVVFFCFLTFPVGIFCATSTVDSKELKTFTSQDGAFQFRYSQILYWCQSDSVQEDQSEPVGTCESQMSICDDDDDSTLTLACFGYPHEVATFAVAEVKDVLTESTCLKGPVDWPMETHGIRTIHGVKFKVFDVSSAWTGGGLRGQLYRTFHASKCYELGIRSAWSSHNNDETDDNNKSSKVAAIEVRKCLKQALNSFRFLK